MKKGRVTIPTNLDVVPQTLEILDEWGADAIRDCDGTEIPEGIKRHWLQDICNLLYNP